MPKTKPPARRGRPKKKTATAATAAAVTVPRPDPLQQALDRRAFGKFKTKSMRYVVENDLDWLHWVYRCKRAEGCYDRKPGPGDLAIRLLCKAFPLGVRDEAERELQDEAATYAVAEPPASPAPADSAYYPLTVQRLDDGGVVGPAHQVWDQLGGDAAIAEGWYLGHHTSMDVLLIMKLDNPDDWPALAARGVTEPLFAGDSATVEHCVARAAAGSRLHQLALYLDGRPPDLMVWVPAGLMPKTPDKETPDARPPDQDAGPLRQPAGVAGGRGDADGVAAREPAAGPGGVEPGGRADLQGAEGGGGGGGETPQGPGPTVDPKLADLRGVFADGHTEEDVDRVFGRFEDALGVRLVCVWEYVDVVGRTECCGGGSAFYAVGPGGGLYHVPPAIDGWLTDVDEDYPPPAAWDVTDVEPAGREPPATVDRYNLAWEDRR